ncbi:unnamed protein product [Didymodactylos carnosus]|uniref:MULE transposase domain-containing protein n=1 Tax=Didymodactylos carnosus TaxID=1234261 RepID=A0A815RNP6_9BILA|nr:unnamed protein product [Didymodactylos carnosus]CAF4344320.1 unnamed protein product [Didymodactylos carnosus]
MQNDYNTNARFARQARMIVCLALIPVDDVVDAFGELSDELPLAFKPLLLYFQQTYIGRTRPYGRAKPQYDLAFWNINVRITDGLVRTTNGAESWHARLKSIFNCDHPSMWKFIQHLQHEENYIYTRIVRLDAGDAPDPGKKYLDHTKRLLHLINNPHSNIMDQLENLAHNIKL